MAVQKTSYRIICCLIAALVAVSSPLAQQRDTDVNSADLARQVADVAIRDELLSVMLESQWPMFEAFISQSFNRFRLSSDARDRFLEHFREEFVRNIGETMRNEVSHVYSEVFTQSELRGMLAFYRTPAGQAVLDKGPQVGRLTAQRMSRVGEEIGRRAGQRAYEEVIENGEDLFDDPELQKFIEQQRQSGANTGV